MFNADSATMSRMNDDGRATPIRDLLIPCVVGIIVVLVVAFTVGLPNSRNVTHTNGDPNAPVLVFGTIALAILALSVIGTLVVGWRAIRR